ncbi:fatty acid transporter [Bordetella genomosp. 1]|uniref:Fatty acid transporter n=1 Tax=Bordetella genomosp. 1 TaxID=1395607 RepID=A0A261S721_9BORD|nr:outer membrane protein transport protein [Bordetella genomosp. 1]MDQ8032777.1 outer membrane protein transport protein [Bordetella sp.]OZI32965.1 fatty acid transporter [Bordetella genomosp. 1]OZI57069.1 fatty acid transporter [Bordetella genomosp. 1]
MTRRSLALKTLCAALGTLGAAQVHAAGFQLLEQNASGLGNAYAGSAANPENASVMYYNPAGITYLKGANATAGVNFIWPSFKFRDNGDSRNPGAPGLPGSTGLGGSVPTGGNGGDAGHLGVVPNAYFSWQVNEQWYLGIGVGAPFGLMTEYDDDWVGQYHSNKFDIRTINVNPTIAYKVNDQFSMGFGLNWQRIDAEYKKKTVVPLPGTPFFSNGDAKLKLDDDAWGWNIGFMLQPTEATRIGLSYRSKIRYKAKGDTDVSNISTPLGTQSVSYDASANVDLPDSLILSASHQLNERWELLGDVSWTGWSSIQELKIKNSGGPTDTLPLGFRDTWRVALGANYKFAPQWKWKFGVAYDQSPVHKASDRPTSLPDTDRWWFATGVQWAPTANTTIDLSYAYLYLRDTDIDTTSGSQASKGRVAGTYSGKGNIVGLQVSTRF